MTQNNFKQKRFMIDLQKVQNTHGVYKFFNKKEIIYIGAAKD